MRKATSTVLAALIVAVMMAMSAGSALAGWAWEDTVSSPSTVVSPDSGKSAKGTLTVSQKGSSTWVVSGKGR